MYVWKKHHLDLPFKLKRRIPCRLLSLEILRQHEVSPGTVLGGMCGRFPLPWEGRGTAGFQCLRAQGQISQCEGGSCFFVLEFSKGPLPSPTPSSVSSSSYSSGSKATKTADCCRFGILAGHCLSLMPWAQLTCDLPNCQGT